MKLHYPGLLEERLPSGSLRYRVRVEGDPRRRIAVPVNPEHPESHAIYAAARRGIVLAPSAKTTPAQGTMRWLMGLYLAHLSRMVQAEEASPLTLRERRSLGAYILAQESEQPRSRGQRYGDLPMMMPETELIAFRDRMAGKPGKARNVWKLLCAMYDFGVERSHCRANPARAVARPKYRSKGGARPWTLDDLAQYREAHPAGTMAHLALSLFMFTACRIGDAVILGRTHEERHGGRPWLAWQPRKKGSRPVSIPVLPPLEAAIRAQTVVGPTYLMTEQGRPFASPEALRNRLAKWCATAGLEGLSSHGVRKAAGHLLALHGATQYEIMSVHGHANAATSQVYTETVERMRLGELAASRLKALEW